MTIDDFEKTVNDIIALTGELTEEECKLLDIIKILKLQRDDYEQMIDELCNRAWGRVYPNKTDWDYPSQAINHLIALCDELERKANA